MKRFRDAIPDKVLDEILPKKLNTSLSTEQIYTPLKQMILSGKLKKGQRLLRLEFVQIFDVDERIVPKAFSQLRKEELVIIKDGRCSFVA